MQEIERNACTSPLNAFHLTSLSLLVAWGSLAFAAQPKEVVYTAKDLGLEQYFSAASAKFLLKSKDRYEGLHILGPLNAGKRSGQDAFYWPPAIAILNGCSLKKLGERLGYKQVIVLATDHGRVEALNPDAGERSEIRFVAPAYVLTPDDISHSRVLLDFDSPQAEGLDRLCLNGMK